MRRSRFSEGQIIGVLRELEAGVKTPELCRKHGISGLKVGSTSAVANLERAHKSTFVTNFNVVRDGDSAIALAP